MTDLFLVDFGVDTSGMFHLRTGHDLAVFALHAFVMVGVFFVFAAVMTL